MLDRTPFAHFKNKLASDDTMDDTSHIAQGFYNLRLAELELLLSMWTSFPQHCLPRMLVARCMGGGGGGGSNDDNDDVLMFSVRI